MAKTTPATPATPTPTNPHTLRTYLGLNTTVGKWAWNNALIATAVVGGFGGYSAVNPNPKPTEFYEANLDADSDMDGAVRLENQVTYPFLRNENGKLESASMLRTQELEAARKGYEATWRGARTDYTTNQSTINTDIDNKRQTALDSYEAASGN